MSFSAQSSLSTNRITIAIPDFKNISGNRGYDFLEKTVAESLTTSLQKSGKFNIVERQRLLEIMEEKKLVLSGLADQDISGEEKIGALASADHLILGSISSAGSRVEINARLVRVDTGEVLLAEKITEDMGDKLFTRINDLADEIILTLSGEKTGLLDLDSTPRGAEVKIGDQSLGETPITGKKMSPGKYSATLLHDDYEIGTVNFEIEADRKTSVNEALDKKPERVLYNFFGIGGHPVDAIGPDYQLDWDLSYERRIGNLGLGLELGTIMFWHTYQDTNAPGTVFQDTMYLNYYRADLFLKYYLFPDSTFVTPYAGGGIGFTIIDNSIYSLSQTALYYKGIVGLCFLPANKFSFYIEGIYSGLGTVTLNEKRFNLFGNYTLSPDQVSLNNFLFGLGIRFGF
jgi:TolB-like protein